MLRKAIHSAKRRVAHRLREVRLRRAPQVDVHGFPLVDLGPRSSAVDPAIRTKVDEALRIIAHFAPTRFVELRRDVSYICLRPMPGLRGRYWSQHRAIVLASDFVRVRGNARIALTIIHEATHARLFRAGFGYDDTNRDRIERVCKSAEINLARRIPDSEQALANLEWEIEQPGATDNERAKHHVDELVANEYPAWFVRRVSRRNGFVYTAGESDADSPVT